MRKTLLAFAVATLTLAAVPASQAAPIAPLPAGASTVHATQVQWRWHGRRWAHRRCWRGPGGIWRCRYW
jgi:hypothetical protein